MNVEEWLGIKNQLGIDIWNKKYRCEDESFEEWLDRVSGGDNKLKNLIKERKFLFGGRTLTNRGTKGGGSFFNCYSSGFAEDSYEKLLELNKNIGLTYKVQGGQGVSLSKLRPKGTPIGTRYESDGIVPFMEIFNTTTKATSQGNSRKGALMISLDIRHKEAETFIKIKSEQNKIDKANLSLEIDDEFMKAVETYYKTGETIVIHEKRDYSGHKIEYDIVPIKLYKMLVENCYNWADPACLFTERLRNYNLMEFDNEYQIETSNPCGEQPLPKNFCCNLGSLNLNEFVLNPYTKRAVFNWNDFYNSIPIAIEALDTIIEENADNHPLKEQKENSTNYRNIGLGVMGLANCLMKLGIKYGSQEAIDFVNVLFDNLFRNSVYSSADLADKKGKFLKYNNVIFDSEIIKKHFSQEDIYKLKETGLRNCSLVSIAPTGSIGTMLGISGGIEPEFALKFKRKTESLDNGKEKLYDVYCNSVLEYQKINNTKNIPDYFVSSENIVWKNRVDMQATMQNHVDTAISSTVNLPKETPTGDVEKLYLYAWQQGIKGITIYRSGCKKDGILTTLKAEAEPAEVKSTEEQDLPWGTTIQISDDLIGKKRKIITGCGSVHVQTWFDPDTGRLMETFFSKGSSGGCLGNLTALSRMTSLAVRTGADFHYVLDQLKSVPPCPAYAVRCAVHKDCSRGNNCASAIANVFEDMYKEVQDEIFADFEQNELEEIPEPINEKVKQNDDVPRCPECGSEIQFQEGCQNCPNCSYSKCG